MKAPRDFRGEMIQFRQVRRRSGNEPYRDALAHAPGQAAAEQFRIHIQAEFRGRPSRQRLFRFDDVHGEFPFICIVNHSGRTPELFRVLHR